MDSDYFLSGLFANVTVNALSASVLIAFSLAFLLLIVSGFMSASEVAFFSLSPGDLNEIQEENRSVDTTIRKLLERSEYLLAAILIGNNFVNVAVVMLCTYGIHAWIDFTQAPLFGFILETVFLTFLLLLCGEIMPKIYAQKNALRFVRTATPTLKVLEYFCRPLSRILVNSTSLIHKTLVKKKADLSVDELSKALELTSTEIPEEKEMLAEILKFYNKTANEVMTPRLDLEDLDIKTSFRKVLEFVVQMGYSRVPVYAGTEDNIKGILYIKDLLPYIDKPDTFRWQSLLRPAYFVPETKKIDDLLEEFRTNKIHMAIVVDEFGGTSGMVTLEGLVEEIFGEIEDEHDTRSHVMKQIGDHEYILSGRVEIDTLNETFGLDLPESDDYVTIAGFILHFYQKFPKLNETVSTDKFTFKIIKVTATKIELVRMKVEES